MTLLYSVSSPTIQSFFYIENRTLAKSYDITCNNNIFVKHLSIVEIGAFLEQYLET